MADIGRRPVVVLSAQRGHPTARPGTRGPRTTTIRGLASEVVLEPADDPVPLRSAVNLDSIESVSVAVLVQRLAGWPRFACARSVPPSPSRSIAPADKPPRTAAGPRVGYRPEHHDSRNHH